MKSTADLKKSYDLKLKELIKEANAQRINNSTNKAKAVWDTINQERVSAKSEESSFKFLIVNEDVIKDLAEMARRFKEYLSNLAERTLKLQPAPNDTQHILPLSTGSHEGFPMQIVAPTTDEELPI